jgi:hypothetical protein
MWTYLLGPFLALLPKPWRDGVSFTQYAQVNRATVLSGVIESIGAIVAMGYWYVYEMSAWVDRATAGALAGKLGPVNDQQIAAVALSVFLTQPLTWVLAYLILEGAARLCGAAFSDSTLGSLPLFLLDRIFISPFRDSTRNRASADNLRGNASSFWGSVRERMMVARLPQFQDEISFRISGADEFLEVSASRRKDDWNPPRVVRYEQSYYRLESASLGSGPRPFRYTLRKLAAGVPGRSVLQYSPTDVLVRQ